ncbi:hypothetical protein [Pseudoalteromonas sp. 68 DY56-GL68]|uniref:hypothetical protein n=1 Tax=Pseudoalteromonas sp. 68 DY56-GL68 TaxID=2974919 RepID=UPI00352B61EA
MKRFILFVILGVIFGQAYAGELYRAPSAGDSGKYFVLENENLGGRIIKVLTSRVGKNNEYTDFTQLKINCNTNQYFTLAGSSEDGAKDNPSKPLKDWSTNSKWTGLIVGSSKYDLVNYICRKF